MNELGMQKLIVDAVNANGGFARKLSHRFLVGVPDLLVKIPGFPAGILEVKRTDLSPKAMASAKSGVTLDVTGPQKRFLREAGIAGIPVGVASFIQCRGGGVASLQFGILTWYEMENTAGLISMLSHHPLGSASSRPTVIFEQLTAWMEVSCAR